MGIWDGTSHVNKDGGVVNDLPPHHSLFVMQIYLINVQSILIDIINMQIDLINTQIILICKIFTAAKGAKQYGRN
jgi:hypothetical protein